ncbi:MAG TPA: FkbM family methyltransferase [Chthoniobacterales bacterium]|nr:FkbM family methyltransferase [Chthoniobacterales bacterium]
MFDIGAHCGVSTYHFSRLVGPAGRVIAFEPDPLNHSLLVRNIERHQLSNVTAVDSAIAATHGYATFLTEGTIGSNLARTCSRDTVGSTIQVPAMTLSEAFRTYGKPARCKVDIEGAELEVLEASQDLLASERTNLVLDTNHRVGGALTTDRVESILRRCGYECASMTEPATTWARPLAFSPA